MAKIEDVEFEENEFEFDNEVPDPEEGEVEPKVNAQEKDAAKIKQQRQEQKEQTLKRKLQKPNSDLILEAKNIWEQLRQKRLNKQERRDLMDQMMKIVTGKALDVILIH
jgi:F0F1-type ATP synthase membrane subunit b/b'